MHAHCGSSLSLFSSHSHLHVSCALWALLLISLTTPFTSSPSSSSLLSPCCSCCPTSSTSLMSWINSLRTSAEDLGTLAENDSSTGYEPNDHFITEAYVEFTQEPLGEQRIPEDFDFDDVTIGQILLNACRRRADHSEEEGLSSCLSSSVSHDRTVKPVVCRLVSSAQETQRHNSENEQIRTLLERQREQILAGCQAEIRKHEFQADYDRRSIQNLNETIESQKEEICRAHQGDERHRQDQQLLHEQLLKQNWISVKLLRKVSKKWKNWSDFKVPHSTQLRGENWSKIEILSLNSLARYRSCKMKLSVWMIPEIFKMLNQDAVDIPTLPVNLCLSHLIQFLVEW